MDAIIDYRGKTPKKTTSGIPLITAKIIKGGRIQDVTEFIAEENYDSWMVRGIPQCGDVVLTTEAPLGEVAQLDSRKVALAQRVITLRGKKGLLSNDYLAYLLQSRYVQHQLDGRGTGSTVKGIKQSELKEVELTFPSYDMQEQVASHLKKIDVKIDLNRQINQTLEQMAQTLFKSWFVDFDPVIDNALDAGSDIPEVFETRVERRKAVRESADFKALPDDVRQLFPSEFEESELGWVPKGWEFGTVSDLLVLQRGFDLPKTKRVAGDYALIASSGQDGTHNEAKVKGPGITTGRSGKIGIVTFVFGDFWPLNTTLWVKEYRASNPYHALFYLKTLPLETLNSGSAVPTLNRNYVHNLPAVVPNSSVLDKFESLVSGSFKKINLNQLENESLTKLRDTLLPKLISGELRLDSPEVEQAKALVD
ncbi:restriction endonuclease subunit S [Vibrio sp. RE86]|uniref:restriction endonuclease subunit S n=1 Tax=Vibrio sp. RE86 TaxID=2607605 RepID=UPI0020A3F4AA|nr:restriction endonuclease subunit S [Vibrio sp. RE86]